MDNDSEDFGDSCRNSVAPWHFRLLFVPGLESNRLALTAGSPIAYLLDNLHLNPIGVVAGLVAQGCDFHRNLFAGWIYFAAKNCR